MSFKKWKMSIPLVYQNTTRNTLKISLHICPNCKIQPEQEMYYMTFWDVKWRASMTVEEPDYIRIEMTWDRKCNCLPIEPQILQFEWTHCEILGM